MGTVRQPARAKSGLFRPLACLAPSEKLAARCMAGLAPGLGSSRPVSAHRRARAMASPMVPRAHGGEAMSTEIPSRLLASWHRVAADGLWLLKNFGPVPLRPQ